MSERFPPEYLANQRELFSFWAVYYFRRLKIGAVRIGHHWFSDPYNMPGYEQMINTFMPRDPEVMQLFCRCKFRVEFFYLALLGKYDAIERVVKSKAGIS